VVTVIALTSCISVLFTLGLVAVVRPFRTKVQVGPQTAAEERVRLDTLADVAGLADRLRPAITQVVAKHAKGEAWGSGVIYQRDGLMLTSHHIVHGSDSVRVVLSDGRQVGARLIGSDPDTDIAVLDLDGGDFTIASLAEAGTVRVGQPAITIGSPSGSNGGPVVRVGVVSALGQEAGAGSQKLVDMIETDSAVAPGCSGAAVVDSSGAVIGIASTNVETDAGVVGYAIPIEVAQAIAAQLMNEGAVHRGWLGIEGESLAPSKAKELGVAGGAVVKKVKPSSPASVVGLVPADVIVAVDDAAMVSMAALMVRLRSSKPGDTITVTVVRGTERLPLIVTLTEKPAS
jgi:S1-C subfamily serine protease